MKCPKCNFVSFDYNDACPKCNKNLTNERHLMGLHPYKPKPLSMQAPLNEYDADIQDEIIGNGEVAFKEETVDAVPEELLISLDDLSDDEPLPIQMEPEPTPAEPEQKIDDEIFFELSPSDSEETESKKNDIWDPEVLQGIETETESLDISELTADPSVKEEVPGEAKEEELLFDLELEPLEFDLDEEESEEKKS